MLAEKRPALDLTQQGGKTGLIEDSGDGVPEAVIGYGIGLHCTPLKFNDNGPNRLAG